jgi:hypothetical protein
MVMDHGTFAVAAEGVTAVAVARISPLVENATGDACTAAVSTNVQAGIVAVAVRRPPISSRSELAQFHVFAMYPAGTTIGGYPMIIELPGDAVGVLVVAA